MHLPEKLEGGIKLGTASVQGWGPVPLELHLCPAPPRAPLSPLPPCPPADAAVAAAAAAAKTEVERRARKHFSFFFFFLLSLFLNQARMSVQQPCWCKINK